MNGLRTAALYGYRPHILGLCGPDEARKQQLLKKFLQGKIPLPRMRPIFKKFLGAYGYYKLIAQSNKIKDPFNQQVINAYWIGNSLLNKVKTEDLRKLVAKDFSGPGLLPRETAAAKAATIHQNSKPHHSFHVLVIGSVTGTIDFKNTRLKDLCRVGWGRVMKISNFPRARTFGSVRGRQFSTLRVVARRAIISKIIAEYEPLIGKKYLKLGKPIEKEIIWDREILPEVKTNDWISFHWNYAVQILKPEEIANLKKYTQNTLHSLYDKK